MQFKGNAIVIPGQHTNADTAMGWYLGFDSLPPEEIAARFMSGIDPDIAKNARSGDILVGGENFGFGKVHGSFFKAMRTIGIQCIVAQSFSTQMVQTALMQPNTFLVESPSILSGVNMGDEIEVDLDTAETRNLTQGTVIPGKEFPPFLVDVMKAGGQVGYLARKIARQKGSQSLASKNITSTRGDHMPTATEKRINLKGACAGKGVYASTGCLRCTQRQAD